MTFARAPVGEVPYQTDFFLSKGWQRRALRIALPREFGEQSRRLAAVDGFRGGCRAGAGIGCVARCPQGCRRVEDNDVPGRARTAGQHSADDGGAVGRAFYQQIGQALPLESKIFRRPLEFAQGFAGHFSDQCPAGQCHFVEPILTVDDQRMLGAEQRQGLGQQRPQFVATHAQKLEASARPDWPAGPAG